MDGKCARGVITCRLTARNMVTNACHCSRCQRESGSAFVLTAMIGAARPEVAGGAEYVTLSANSSKGQDASRCPTCNVAICRRHAGAGRLAAFVRVGTVNNPVACLPHVHVFTSDRLPRITLNDSAPVYADHNDLITRWPQASQRCRLAMKQRASKRD